MVSSRTYYREIPSSISGKAQLKATHTDSEVIIRLILDDRIEPAIANEYSFYTQSQGSIPGPSTSIRTKTYVTGARYRFGVLGFNILIEDGPIMSTIRLFGQVSGLTTSWFLCRGLYL